MNKRQRKKKLKKRVLLFQIDLQDGLREMLVGKPVLYHDEVVGIVTQIVHDKMEAHGLEFGKGYSMKVGKQTSEERAERVAPLITLSITDPEMIKLLRPDMPSALSLGYFQSQC